MHAKRRPFLQTVAVLLIALAVAVGAAPVVAWSAGAEQTIVTGFGPRAIAAADLDGDGMADLVTANTPDRSLSIVRDPLGAGLPVTVPLIGDPVTLAVSDVDGDRVTDIVVGLANPSGIMLLAGDGSGGWRDPVTTALSAVPDALAVADLGDGSVSIVAGTGDGVLWILRAAPGSLVVAGSLRVGGVPIAVARTATRRGQLAVADGIAGTLTLVRADQGRLKVTGRLALGAQAGGMVAVRDASGPLLVVTLPQGNEVVLVRVPASGRMAVIQRLVVAATPFGIAAGDLDADGSPELAVSARSGGGLHVLDLVRGSLVAGAVSPMGICPSSLAIARLDGDALPDIAAAQPCSNEVVVVPGG